MTRKKSPSWVLELPLAVRPDQAKRLQAHLEAARCLYNALLGEAKKRLNRMRSDPAWQGARAIPRTRKQERKAAFSRLRRQYGFAEYAMHDYAKELAGTGLLITWTRRWRKPWRAGPIKPSIACAWGKPNRYAFAAKVEAWVAWRASATIPACVSFCNRQRKATKGVSCGARITPRID